MIFTLILLGLVAIGFAVWSLNDYEHVAAAAWCAVATALLVWAWALSNTPERVAARYAEQQAEAAAASAAALPHVIAKSADGCKVYKFRDDTRDHYFTSCPDSRTTTDSQHDERSGKTSTTVVESITSEVNP